MTSKDGEGFDYDDDHAFEDYDDDYGNERCDLCGLSFEDGCTCKECGMTESGHCMLAGTEHCDWDCTYPQSARSGSFEGDAP